MDANILYSIFLTDLFLNLHELGLCNVVWSTYVKTEAERHLLADALDDVTKQVRRRRFDRMRIFALQQSIPRSRVIRVDSARSPNIAIDLPDEGDILVARDAIASGAEVLVTENGKDFPVRLLHIYNISVLSAEQTLIKLSTREPAAFGRAIDLWLNFNRQFPKTREDFLAFVRQRQYHTLAQRLADIWEAPPAA